ncbi:MAG: 4-hydroxythreonine-4-phosphate dehydrogenase PdxA, partial [Rubrobacter sp.]|nr:4-hydroxythreonine-4-phosphate dehydrogenase PdxA [Rubrobacter sp.]
MSGASKIAITMGDPAGIGPEIVAKSFAGEFSKESRSVVVGDEGIMRRAVKLLGLSLEMNVVEDPADGRYEPGIINLIPAS